MPEDQFNPVLHSYVFFPQSSIALVPARVLTFIVTLICFPSPRGRYVAHVFRTPPASSAGKTFFGELVRYLLSVTRNVDKGITDKVKHHTIPRPPLV